MLGQKMVECQMQLDIFTNGRYILVTIRLMVWLLFAPYMFDHAAHGCYLRFHVSDPVNRAVDGGCTVLVSTSSSNPACLLAYILRDPEGGWRAESGVSWATVLPSASLCLRTWLLSCVSCLRCDTQLHCWKTKQRSKSSSTGVVG
jgi:hypothetical protein